MKILRAEYLGMCFGVRDAIALATHFARQEPLTIMGELVHNETVLARLRREGVQIANSAEQVTTPFAMVTAHGASAAAKGRARNLGLHVMEATCPLVKVAHKAVARLVKEGYYPVIVGKADHVEVRGITEDLAEYEVVLREEDIQRLPERPRYGVAAQTTQRIDHVRRMAALLRERFPLSEVRLVDTVCQPTKQRQHAAVEMARNSDVVIVIGGANSNNTRELVQSCGLYCSRVHHVQTAADLREEWFADCHTVGITAGTSTPDDSINDIEAWIAERFGAMPVGPGESVAAEAAPAVA